MAKPKKAGRVKSRRVWDAWWDTGGMGGGGSGWVNEKGGSYFFRGTEDEPGGPYPTLLEAIQAHCLDRLPMEGVFMEVTSPVLSADEMAEMLDRDEVEYGTALRLNGEVWVYVDPGVLRRAETDEERCWGLAQL